VGFWIIEYDRCVPQVGKVAQDALLAAATVLAVGCKPPVEVDDTRANHEEGPAMVSDVLQPISLALEVESKQQAKVFDAEARPVGTSDLDALAGNVNNMQRMSGS
jgi:hypothetical protein